MEDDRFNQLGNRTLLLASGFIAFFLATGFLDIVSTNMKFSEQTGFEKSSYLHWMFWGFLAYGLFWIGFTIVGIRLASQNESVRAHLMDLFWFQHPLLAQIMAFVEHGVWAVLFVFLTGDVKGGYMLVMLEPVHVIVALVVGPRMVKGIGESG